MKYVFSLHIAKESSTLSILKNGDVSDVRSWPEQRDMGRKLFEAIDVLLQTCGLAPAQVSDFIIESDLPEHATSLRIAETVKKVYAFGVALPRSSEGVAEE